MRRLKYFCESLLSRWPWKGFMEMNFPEKCLNISLHYPTFSFYCLPQIHVRLNYTFVCMPFFHRAAGKSVNFMWICVCNVLNYIDSTQPQTHTKWKYFIPSFLCNEWCARSTERNIKFSDALQGDSAPNQSCQLRSVMKFHEREVKKWFIPKAWCINRKSLLVRLRRKLRKVMVDSHDL